LEYKVVKAIFSVKQVSQVEEISINTENLEMNEKELENILNGFHGKEVKKEQNSNPLFMNPNTPNQNQKPDKKKIRV